MMHRQLIEVVALINVMPFAHMSLDENSKILMVSSAIKEISGYTPEELIGKPLSILIPADVPHPHFSSLHVYVETPPKPLNPLSDVPLLRKNGTVVRVSVERYIFTFPTEAGQALRFGGVIRLLDQSQAYPRATQD